VINRRRERTPRALCETIIKRDQWTCQHCGKVDRRSYLNSLDVHHIKPFAIGGEHTPENLITLCRSCHRKADLKNQIRFYEEQAVIDALDQIAEKRGVERTKVIRWALIEYIERHCAPEDTIVTQETHEPIAA
jgi:hypothetical protein